MKLYYSPGACSLSPHIALKEAGLAFEAVAASTKTHQLADGTDYYSINPLGYVPLLELDDGTRLTEGPTTPTDYKPMVIDKLLSRPKWVDSQLAGKQYLMGDAFSVADPYLFTVTNWAPRVGVDITSLTNITAFRERMAARPAVQAAMKHEGLLK